MIKEQTNKLADAVADRLERSDVLADAVAAKLGGQLHELRGQLLELRYQVRDGFAAVNNRLDGMERQPAVKTTPL
ncbi:MAG: hypothetical protein OXH08_04455 [Gammaproteobacteria bacterium]|nr:hypothetical protein [Gammaproteobacteria bacterium]MDE0475090.1 hypothetical protein [Gammaproteobacteria bacterium]MDE0650985.1 hypothetical protein [Gammaproteobacteria bacterium]MYC99191.1 hypothetical protein [Gammaproteobacteria bacterium]